MEYKLGSILFEISDKWLDEAGVVGFIPKSTSYLHSPDTAIRVISIADIEPPERKPGVDWFKKDRLLPILNALKCGEPLPPVEVHIPPELEGFKFALRDGFHRFYGSLALGFRDIPVIEKEYFDIHAL